jgi:hypothetical protein
MPLLRLEPIKEEEIEDVLLASMELGFSFVRPLVIAEWGLSVSES